MMKKFFRSRSWRKFTANRTAMACLGIIALYLVVALLGFAGVIDRTDTQDRTLPDRTPGFLEERSLQGRTTTARWFIERTRLRVDRAQQSPDSYDSLMSELSMFERTVADVPLPELATRLEAAEAKLDALDLVLDDRDILLDDQLDIDLDLDALLRRDNPNPERVARLQAERNELEAQLPEADRLAQESLEELEASILEFHPWPDGFGGFWYGVRTFLGSDAQGRSISMKALFSVRIAFQIGLVVATISVIIGTLLGAAAGFFGGIIDYAVMYLVSVLSSIPTLVLLGVLVYMFFGSAWFDNPAERPGLALVPVYCAMCLTFWVSTCRVIRGEVMKIRSLEYVQAATSIGFGRIYILFRHVIPNTAHLMFINLSLLFIGAIKSEVILSFLGLGVKGQPSWGVMISQAKDDISVGFFWEVATASVLMFGLVLAFNIVSDALQDAFDPKHVS